MIDEIRLFQFFKLVVNFSSQFKMPCISSSIFVFANTFDQICVLNCWLAFSNVSCHHKWKSSWETGIPMSIARIYVCLLFRLAVKDFRRVIAEYLFLKYSIFYYKIHLIGRVCFKTLQKPRNDVENKVIVARYKAQQEHNVCNIRVYACNFSTKNCIGFLFIQ